MERTIEILQHEISYWYKNDQEMPDHEEEHIIEMITGGFSSGQLVDGDNTGWWKIVKPNPPLWAGGRIMGYRYATNNDIKIRVNLEKSESMIEYCLINNHDDPDDWKPTPFNRTAINHEGDALVLICNWLD